MTTELRLDDNLLYLEQGDKPWEYFGTSLNRLFGIQEIVDTGSAFRITFNSVSGTSRRIVESRGIFRQSKNGHRCTIIYQSQ
jgi:hypothetical protein